MPGQAYDVTFSVGLIEKLAGIKKPEPARPAPTAAPARIAPPPLPPRALGQLPISSEAQRLMHQDAQLGRMLSVAREVNGLLLRHEAEEVKRVKAHADKLVKQYSVKPKPVPCAQERQACTKCFQENAQDASRCEAVAKAYSACALGAYMQQP